MTQRGLLAIRTIDGLQDRSRRTSTCTARRGNGFFSRHQQPHPLPLSCPVPLDTSATAKVGMHLRDAIRKVNDGEYGDAVIAARRAIDDMGASWASERSVVQTPREQRTFDQRLALLRHALQKLASPSAHGDPVAVSISWDREKALAVIAGVSALAACKD